jgi:hypothetical protein
MRDIDDVIKGVQKICPTVEVEQIKALHPGDDDGIWFFDGPACSYQVQIESSNGMCPFVIETDENETRFSGKSVEETVQTVCKLLHIAE